MAHEQSTPVAKGSDQQPISSQPFLEQLEQLRQLSPDLYSTVDLARILESAYPQPVLDAISCVTDFEAFSQGGRGESYRNAQQNPIVRAVGIRQLFALISSRGQLASLSPRSRILDVLGGDGTLTRALSTFMPSPAMPAILTSDLSADMVAAALAQGLASLRQPAQHLLLKDACYHAVIIAYGSHHIPSEQRLLACQEAFRVLQPGGRIAFHDFEHHSPVARWFTEVVDRYSLTGHDFPHFTAEEIRNCLLGAGFGQVTVQYMYDPFILSGASPQQLKLALGEHLLNMYGLVKLSHGQSDQDAWNAVYTLAFNYFRYNYQNMGLHEDFGVPHIQIQEKEEHWCIEMPRVALVGTAVKE